LCFRIGVNGFDNPMRDPKTEEVKKLVGLVSKKTNTHTHTYSNIISLDNSINRRRHVFRAGCQSEDGRSRKHSREKAVRKERIRKEHIERR